MLDGVKPPTNVEINIAWKHVSLLLGGVDSNARLGLSNREAALGHPPNDHVDLSAAFKLRELKILTCWVGRGGADSQQEVGG